MRITILDGEKFSDLDWGPLRSLGEVVVLERTRAADVPRAAAGAACLLTNKSPLDARAISALPELRYIGVLATGYNVVDGAAARARGIPVCNVPEYAPRPSRSIPSLCSSRWRRARPRTP
ncbi:MAG TPA: hypothetical protein VFE31_05090 [Opitutaceae bacterium]|jgi:glycerate dehydrogenase|nr:hypothetical protein [Opitutaceae bacterium]